MERPLAGGAPEHGPWICWRQLPAERLQAEPGCPAAGGRSLANPGGTSAAAHHQATGPHAGRGAGSGGVGGGAASRPAASTHPLRRFPTGVEDPELQGWTAARSGRRRPWIPVMPGPGGDPDHFHRLARGLAPAGWSCGADGAPRQRLRRRAGPAEEGREPLAGAEALRQRMQDLQSGPAGPAPRHPRMCRGIGSGAGSAIPSAPSPALMGHGSGAAAGPAAALLRQALDELPLTNLSTSCCSVSWPRRGHWRRGSRFRSWLAVVGPNSFGSLIWPARLCRAPLPIPVLLLMGGTPDLITPPPAEQLGLLASFGQHPLTRAVIVEGGVMAPPSGWRARAAAAKGMICSDSARSWWVSIPSRCRELLRRELIAFLEQLEGRPISPQPRATTSRDPFAGTDSTAAMPPGWSRRFSSGSVGQGAPPADPPPRSPAPPARRSPPRCPAPPGNRWLMLPAAAGRCRAMRRSLRSAGPPDQRCHGDAGDGQHRQQRTGQAVPPAPRGDSIQPAAAGRFHVVSIAALRAQVQAQRMS